MPVTYPEITFLLRSVQQVLERNAAVGHEIIRWNRCIVENCQRQRLRIFNTMLEILVPHGVERLLFRGGLRHMGFVYIYRYVWIYQLFVRFSKRHIEPFLKVRRPQARSLAYFYTDSSSKHWKTMHCTPPRIAH